MEDRRKLYLQSFFKATPSTSDAPETRRSRLLSGDTADEISVATEAREYKAAYDSIPIAKPKESLLEKTRRLLRQASILSSEQLELANVATDPTYIHIEGRLTKKLLAAIDPAELERRPGPEDLWDTFLPELKTPTPPPTPPPQPAPREPRRKYFLVKGKVVSVVWLPPKKRAVARGAPSSDGDQRMAGGSRWRPEGAGNSASIGSGRGLGDKASSRGSLSSSVTTGGLLGGAARRAAVAAPRGLRRAFGITRGSSAAPGNATSAVAAPPPLVAREPVGSDGGRLQSDDAGHPFSEGLRLAPDAGGVAAAAKASQSRRAALPRCPLCSRKACIQHAFEATEKLRRFMKKPASRELTFYSLYAS